MLEQLIDPGRYAFSVYAIPTFIAAAVTFLFGLTLLIRQRGGRLGWTFFCMSFMGSLWFFSFSWMYCALDETIALVWAKMGSLAVIFLPSAVYHFSIAILCLERQRQGWKSVSWLLSALFALTLLLSDRFISGLYRYAWGYYPKVGWLSVPFLLFFFGMMYLSFSEYDAQFLNAAAGIHSKRAQSFLKAFGVAYLASFDFLANYGVPLYPFGYIPVLLFLFIVAQTILAL